MPTNVQKFAEDGYIVINELFDRVKIDCARQKAMLNFETIRANIDGKLDFGVGIKNGFKEIVQRHPKRYEMTYGVDDEFFDFVLENSLIKDTVAGILECEDFIVANRSIVISEPNCDDQGWHSDGPHVNMSKYVPCHCLNVFVPLVDVDISNGPTQFRPGSQFYTRDLAKQFLIAKIKKQLREIETPVLRTGSILMFDYRVLHRGTANRSAKPRPILVFTFAKPWFKDILNFPARSVFNNV